MKKKFKRTLKEIVDRTDTIKILESYPICFLEDKKEDVYALISETVHNLQTLRKKASDKIINKEDLSDITMFLSYVLYDIDKETIKLIKVKERLKKQNE